MGVKDCIAPVVGLFVAANLFLFLHLQFAQNPAGRDLGAIRARWETIRARPSECPPGSRPPLHLGTSFGASNRSWVVLTTDRDAPSGFVRALSAKSVDWRILAVGTRDLSAERRREWDSLRLVTYLGPSEQRAMKLRVGDLVPVGSKNFGLLHAVRHGAVRLLESEDGDDAFDHRLLDDPEAVFLSPHPSEIDVYDADADGARSRGDPPLFDPFRRFVARGVPGEVRARGVGRAGSSASSSARDPTARLSKGCRKLLIQHSVQNGVPDHDLDGGDGRYEAVWSALTRGPAVRDAHGTLPFDDSRPIAVPKGTFAPFNGRATLYHADALWASVALDPDGRPFADVWKALWAERIAWELRSDVGFLRPMLTRISRGNATAATARARPQASTEPETGTSASRTEERERVARMASFLRDVRVEIAHDLPSAAVALAQDAGASAGGWDDRDVELLFAWFADLRDAGYEFPVFLRACDADRGADPDADASLYAVARPVELLRAAFLAPNVYFCCGASSLSPWRRWFGNATSSGTAATTPIVANDVARLGTAEAPLFEATVVLEFSRLSMRDLEGALRRLLASDARTVAVYHAVRTFCPPGCEDEAGVETMSRVAGIVEDLLALRREWTVEWEPLIPGETKYPSPWILRRDPYPASERQVLANITRRQFPARCDHDLYWYLSYYLKVGMNGGFAYGIHMVAGDLYNALLYEGVVMDWSRREWPSYFGDRDGMELDGRRVCDGADVGCVLLPATNCTARDPARTVDQWDIHYRGRIDETPVANWTRRVPGEPVDGRLVLTWMYRLKKFFRDEIRRVVESLPIPARWVSVHVRRGNKIIEAEHTPIRNYLETLDSVLASGTGAGVGAREIYVCTDSEVALRELSAHADRYRFHVDWAQKRFQEDAAKPHWEEESAFWLVPGQTTERTPYWNHRAVVGTLIDLWFMVHAEQHVGTSTSNVFTFVRAVRANEKRRMPVSLAHQGQFQHNLGG